MTTVEEIESYLIRMDSSYDQVGNDIWIVKDGGADLVISIAGPVLVLRVKLLELDRVGEDRRSDFFRTLLELNATEMLHGAYGIEQGVVVATDALEMENLDFNEFQASLDDLAIAISKHYPILNQFASANLR